MKEFNVFLASCSDVSKYRKIAQKVIDELNESLGEELSCRAKLFRWEKSTVPEMGRPQEVIFRQADFDRTELFIGILGNRFGTPTGGVDKNNKEYESGTKEEFDRAYNMFITRGSPHIMIFKCNAPIKPGSFDVEQYNKVQMFIDEFNANKANPGLYKTFTGSKDFETAFRVSMTKYYFKQSEKRIQSSPVNLSDEYQKEGFLKLFVPTTNKERNIDKMEAVVNAKMVYLIAKTGNSYLGTIGNRFLEALVEITQKGGDVRILLQSPWSVNAVSTAFAESGDIKSFINLLQHQTPSQALIEAYKNTEWFKLKLMDVINGYREIQGTNPSIKLRFIDTDLSASLLITDQNLFYEPYLNLINRSRLKKRAITFEVKMNSNVPFYNNAKKHFETLWESAISYEKLIKQESHYINLLANCIDAAYVNNTTYYIGIHVLIRKGNEFLALRRTDSKPYMPSKWDIPGGSMEVGEGIEDTAVREVLEETGLKVVPKEILYTYVNSIELPARQTLQIIMDAEYLGGEVKTNPNEHDAWRWVTKEEALKLPTINFLQSYLEELTDKKTDSKSC